MAEGLKACPCGAAIVLPAVEKLFESISRLLDETDNPRTATLTQINRRQKSLLAAAEKCDEKVGALRAEVERTDKAERAATDLVTELRSEIAALTAELAEQRMYAEGYGNEVAALKAELAACESHFKQRCQELQVVGKSLVESRAELARYTGPLTDEQYKAIDSSISDGWGHRDDYETLRTIDAAIREVRGK